ncbi:Major facilitator superfamily domain, general substrate transporter [Metarhizium guizhouense ARSEF 977]|uniref:Major facilitator superfamily domain, general substrate transporter n=1 Tax=Metarhizium guizhouense (strain ARSEF 977) TaxID=1276136 RepID=A0A0B4HYM8_METGA|nr:Major facilitator superfamily domain, general substrate transporter [Metarhizium guizhouense ARSEF 977]
MLGQAIAGAGGGATNAISTFVGADLVPLRKRGVIQGVNNIAMGCGTGLGGFVGGLLNQLAGWRAAFFNVDTGPSDCRGTRLVGNPT